MPSAIASRRLEVLAAVRRDPSGIRFEREGLRFSLGTSLADFSVPIEVAQDARAIVRGAMAEVALLLSTHHRSFVSGDDVDRLILHEDYAGLPSVPAQLAPSGGGPDLRAASQLAPAIHPALTGGILGAWMGRGGRGRSLVALWIELLRRAFEEMEATRGREQTPLLVSFALAAETAAAGTDAKSCLPSPPVDRYLRTAALSAGWLAARTGLARAWRDAGRGPDDPLLARIEAVLAPTPLLGGRAGVIGGGATLYGCELAVPIPREADVSARILGGAEPAAARTEIEEALAGDKEIGRRVEQAVAVARLRDLLGAAVAAAEAAGSGAAVDALRGLYCAPGAFAAAVGDERERKDLARRLLDAAPGGEATALLERASRAVAGFKQKDPAAAVGLDRKEARAEYSLAAVAMFSDLALERLCTPARKALSFRTGREEEGGAELEWEGGRLYRLSTRPGPILAEARDLPTGHLFADLKDFTRRTSLLGQASMAEYLRREFYVPILVAAKEHFGGMQHLADRGGVVLNNLLGDAVSFAGRIDEMVVLAKAIRSRFAEYALRLSREVSSDVVGQQIATIESSHASGIEDAAAARAAAEAALPAAAPATPQHAALVSRIARARAEEARLVAERDRALARARGEVLEAGIFLSHGPAPLVLLIEDEVFGRNRVAVAEKINESARGTARVPAARARADAGLARERVRRRNPALDHAWSVFLGLPLQLSIPPDSEDQALRLFRAGDVQGAMRALAAPVRDGLEAAARAPGERPGDIYNSGAAISEEALEAYLAEVGESRAVRRIDLPTEEIPEALRARWFFGDEPLTLVACFQADGRTGELFRRVGRAAFKGLGGVVVWELCAETGGPGALAHALGPSWFRGGGAP